MSSREAQFRHHRTYREIGEPLDEQRPAIAGDDLAWSDVFGRLLIAESFSAFELAEVKRQKGVPRAMVSVVSPSEGRRFLLPVFHTDDFNALWWVFNEFDFREDDDIVIYHISEGYDRARPKLQVEVREAGWLETATRIRSDPEAVPTEERLSHYESRPAFQHKPGPFKLDPVTKYPIDHQKQYGYEDYDDHGRPKPRWERGWMPLIVTGLIAALVIGALVAMPSSP